MNMFLLSMATGIAIGIAAAAIVFWRFWYRLPVEIEAPPESPPRSAQPRAVTRIHSNQLDWEIK